VLLKRGETDFKPRRGTILYLNHVASNGDLHTPALDHQRRGRTLIAFNYLNKKKGEKLKNYRTQRKGSPTPLSERPKKSKSRTRQPIARGPPNGTNSGLQKKSLRTSPAKDGITKRKAIRKGNKPVGYYAKGLKRVVSLRDRIKAQKRVNLGRECREAMEGVLGGGYIQPTQIRKKSPSPSQQRKSNARPHTWRRTGNEPPKSPPPGKRPDC